MAATINFLKIYFLHFFTKIAQCLFREIFRGADFNYGIMLHALDMLSKIQYGGH